MMMKRFAAMMLAGCAVGCQSERANVKLSEAQTLSAPTAVGTAPMFAVSRSGEEAAAWVSAPNGGTDGRLYISVNGGTPVELTDSLGPIEAHGESPPKLAYGNDGALNAIYVVAKIVPGRRFPAAALRFVRSADGGKTWSAPATVTDDSTFGSHNFHALHAAKDGSIYVAWLDGREGKSNAYVTRSADRGRTWAANQHVAAGEACPCCRTALATADDGTLYVAWRSVENGIRDVVVARSDDRAATFTKPQRVHADDWKFDGCPHAGPSMQVDDKGRVHIAWWTGKEGSAGVYYAHSDDRGATFSEPIAIGTAKFSRPAHVQLALAPDHRLIVVWDDGTVSPQQIRMRVSPDRGGRFREAQQVSAPDRAAGFPVIAVSSKGVSVAWSEKTIASAEREEHGHPNMKDPKATMGLTPVGDAQVVVRRGRVDSD